jgi:DNA-binding CsgD family transcriptional regulator
MIAMGGRLPEPPGKSAVGRSSGRKGPSRAEIRIRLQLVPYSLTKKETEITLLLVEGLKREEILESCDITNNTLKTHIRQIYKKLNVTGRAEIPGKIGLV